MTTFKHAPPVNKYLIGDDKNLSVATLNNNQPFWVRSHCVLRKGPVQELIAQVK